MTAKEFLDEQYKLSVTAGFNQRYHQRYAKLWRKWDTGVKIAVGILAVAGACVTVVTSVVDDWRWDAASLTVASVAAAAAVALNVIPLSEWTSKHQATFERYTDLREEVDALLFDFKEKPTELMRVRLKELAAKLHRICATESCAKAKVLRECQVAEEKSRREPTFCTVTTRPAA